MIVAHLPAGYLVSRLLLDTLGKGWPESERRCLLWFGLFAAILPDLDLIYFYLIDDRQHLHHSYWIHLPVYWLGIGAVLFVTALFARRPGLTHMGLLLLPNVLVHLFLDTVAGKIRWLYPYSREDFVMFRVPARPEHDWWVWNYVFHWTFVFEVLIVALALVTLRLQVHRSWDRAMHRE